MDAPWKRCPDKVAECPHCSCRFGDLWDLFYGSGIPISGEVRPLKCPQCRRPLKVRRTVEVSYQVAEAGT